METRQTNWPRTALVVAVLAAAVVAPWLVATASHGNWDLADLTPLLPWHDPSAGLAGDLTTDAAAASACVEVPTFDVAPVADEALLEVDGPLSLEQANARLAELGVALEVGMVPEVAVAPVDGVSRGGAGPGPAVAGISFGGAGDPAAAHALEAAVGRDGMLAGPVQLPVGAGPSGLLLTCTSRTD